MNKVQRLQLNRVRATQYNSLDGERVARDLMENQHLYRSFVFGRFGHNQLIELRDLASGQLNADTLMILTTIDKLPELEKMAKAWDADEFGSVSAETSGTVEYKFAGTAPFRDEKEGMMAFGAGLSEGCALVRIWWD